MPTITVVRKRGPTSGTVRRGRLQRELLLAIRILARSPIQVEALGTRLGTMRRTAYRIVRALEEAGLRLAREQRGHRVYVSLPRSEVDAWLWTRPLRRARVVGGAQ